MNTLIDKLKLKVKERNEMVEETLNNQKMLITTTKDINFKLRNYIESDIAEKQLYEDTNIKLNNMKTRIENSKNSIKSIKEKILHITNKLNQVK